MRTEAKPPNPSRRRLLVLTSTFPRYQGDHEPSFVYELCRRLAEKHDVTVLAPHAPQTQRQETMAGIKVLRFRYAPPCLETLAYNGGIIANLKQNPFRYGLVPFFLLSQFFVVVKMLRRYDFNVIHAHWLIPQGVIATLGRFYAKKPVKILCTSHGGDLYGLRGRFADWLKKMVIRNSDAVTVVSEAMRAEAKKIAGAEEAKHVQVISMGVDAESTFIPRESKRAANELLFVGRLVEKKGVAYLLEAMPLILEKYPDTILKIVGSGPEKDRLQQQARQLGIENRVYFLGALAQSKIPAHYRRATIFVAPSIIATGGDQEGLGLVFAEALACECAVVASDLPAIADLIIDGHTGVIAKQKNSIDLATQIIRLLNDHDLRQRISHNGRHHVLDRFDWGIIADRYSQVIQDL